MGKPGIAGTRDKFDLHRRARIGHHRRAAGDNLHMVVQTLRIEIQPVSGKGIEVRDDRKTTAVNRLSKAVSHPGPTAPGASTMAKVSPSSGWRSCRPDALPGARRPQRVLLLMATGAGAGVQVRIIRPQATVGRNAGFIWVLPRHVVAGGQTVAEGVFLACAAGIAGLQLAAVVFIVVKAGGQAARLPERQRKETPTT